MHQQQQQAVASSIELRREEQLGRMRESHMIWLERFNDLAAKERNDRQLTQQQ